MVLRSVCISGAEEFQRISLRRRSFHLPDSTDLIRKEDYPAPGVMSPGNAQYDFLERELSTSNDRWKVVYFTTRHMFQADIKSRITTAFPVFERYGVDLVINSHTIVYERSHPLTKGTVDYDNGIVHQQAAPEPCRTGYAQEGMAYLAILGGASFSTSRCNDGPLEVRAIDDEGRLFDTMRIRKALRARGITHRRAMSIGGLQSEQRKVERLWI